MLMNLTHDKRKNTFQVQAKTSFWLFKTGMYKYLIKMKLESNMSKLLKINPL